MKKIAYSIVLLFLFAAVKTSAQYDYNDFSISVNYNYTTTSKLFLSPNSPSEFLRNQSIDFDDVKSASVEIRYRLLESLTLGLSVEQFEKKQVRQNFQFAGILMQIEDGFKIYPVQLTAYYTMPFSTELFKFFMGGGIGLYFGEHIRNLEDVSFIDDGSSTEFGIHVKTGFDYMFRDFVSIRAEMNFRDPEIDLSSKYNSETLSFRNRNLLVPQGTFDTKVNIDGVSFTIGAALHF